MYQTNNREFLSDIMGMPYPHAKKFLHIAKMQRCIIMVRATGKTCLTLLQEGYDTKGFRIHGKSCDWGPMAGFVLRDPRLNKYGEEGTLKNKKAHKQAFSDSNNQGWKASTTPLKISSSRIIWLKRNKVIGNYKTTRGRLDATAKSNDGKIQFDYSLIRSETRANLWGVYFKNKLGQQPWIQYVGQPQIEKENLQHPKDKLCEQMLAMSNPLTHRLHTSDNAPNSHHNAVTGDYDMFALWPNKANYDAKVGGWDHRPLGTVRGSGKDPQGKERKLKIFELEANFVKPWKDESGISHETQESKIGNVTPRIYMVSQLINSAIGGLGTSPGRNLLWHSDEAARPGVDEVDLPMGAFHPDGNWYCIGKNLNSFKAFIDFAIEDGYHVNLSQGWVQPTNHANTIMQLNRSVYGQHIPENGKRIQVPHWYNA